MERFDPHAPVIIGVGQVKERPEADEEGSTSVELIVAAVNAAIADAGGSLQVGMVDWVGIEDVLARPDRLSSPPHAEVLAGLGIEPRHAESSPSPSGNFPVRLLNDLSNRIASGEVRIGVVAGGEAMRNFVRQGGGRVGESGTDVIRNYRASGEEALLRRYGFLTPVDVYPLYEQATRHAWGQTGTEANWESARIWAGNAKMAAENPFAWITKAPTVEEIATPSARNPIISYPYLRMMVANSSVNMAAALVVTSWAQARHLGIPDERIVFVGYGAAANERNGNLDRESFSESPAMQVSLARALELNEVQAGELDHVELYSCFPCIPKMARRVIGWPIDRPHSIYGGLTFGGGPIGNAMTHALVCLVERIRGGSRIGLVFANGGFATKNHSIVLRSTPVPGGFTPRSFDFQSEADRRRGPIPPLLDQYEGSARVETYTVSYREGRPLHATIVARAPTGGRVLACVVADNTEAIGALTDPDLQCVGMAGEIVSDPDGHAQWRFG